MFIPLSTSTPARNVPLLVITLIAINVGVFLASREHLVATNTLLGIQLSKGTGELLASPDTSRRTITHMFAHADWIHLAINCCFLFTFGAPTELRIGSPRFAALYFVCGVGAVLLQSIVIAPNTATILIGSSGAVSGVVGCYLALYPYSRVYGIIFCIPIALPSLIFLTAWALIHVVGVYQQLSHTSSSTTVAWSAHVGAFAIGIVIASFLEHRVRYR